MDACAVNMSFGVHHYIWYSAVGRNAKHIASNVNFVLVCGEICCTSRAVVANVLSSCIPKWKWLPPNLARFFVLKVKNSS